MDASQNRQPRSGLTVSWSAEALLAAGIVAGTVIARSRNPRLTLLLAAGALAWRALKPKQRPAPMLSLLDERVVAEPLMPALEATSAAVIVGAAPHRCVVEAVSPVMEMAPVEEKKVEVIAEPAEALDVANALVPTLPDVVEAQGQAPYEAKDGAWILGLEPVPVVEELPEPPPIVQEHRPIIAEGAPLPDMIEITLEPAPSGLQLAATPVSDEAQPLFVNEGPVVLPAQAEHLEEPLVLCSVPVATAEIPADLHPVAAPVLVPEPVVEAKQELLPPEPVVVVSAPAPQFPFGPLALPSRKTVLPPPVYAPAPVAASDPFPFVQPALPTVQKTQEMLVAEKAKEADEAAKIWASYEAQTPSHASERITLRPMPRTMPSSGSGDLTLAPRKNAVFGQPLPLASTDEQPRRMVPHAPVAEANEGDSKSWLNFWK